MKEDPLYPLLLHLTLMVLGLVVFLRCGLYVLNEFRIRREAKRKDKI